MCSKRTSSSPQVCDKMAYLGSFFFRGELLERESLSIDQSHVAVIAKGDTAISLVANKAI